MLFILIFFLLKIFFNICKVDYASSKCLNLTMTPKLIFRFLNFSSPFFVLSSYSMFVYSIISSSNKLEMVRKNFPLVCLICWMLIATFWSVHTSTFESLHSSMKYILKFLSFICFLSLCKKLNDNRFSSVWSLVCVVFIISVSFFELLGYYFFSEYIYEYFKGVLHREFFTNVSLSIMIPLIACDILIKKPKFYFLSLSVLLSYLFFLNLQRLAIIILSIGVVLILFEHRKKISFQFCVLIFLIPLLLIKSPLMNKFQKGFQQLQSAKYTTKNNTPIYSMEVRYKVFNQSMRSIYKKPFIGHGPGSHTKIFPIFFQQDAFPMLPNSHTHMLYTCITVQYGLIGLCIFIWWIISLLQIANSFEPTSRCRVVFSVLALLVAGIFDDPLYATKSGFLIMSWLAYVIATGHSKVLPFSK